VFSRATRNVVEDVVRVASDCTTWVQFCSAYILFVLERCGVKDVEVVSGFEKMLANQTLMRSVAERVAEALDDGRDAIDLVWGFCDSCKSRFRPEAAGFSYCGQCSRKWDPARDLMLPKILVDNLMDDELFPRTLSFCHIGGMSHIVEGHQMRTIMQLQPTSLDVVSDQGSRSDYNFQFIAEAAARRVVHSVDAAKIRGLYDRSRSGYFSSLYYLVGDEYAALRNA